MRASHQLKYAIYGVFDLAYHGSDRPVCVDEIGRRQRIPPRYLEQIFQRLRRAGLVRSKRGPGGGFQLARDAAEITLADVVLAVQGSVVARPGDGEAEPDECPCFVWDAIQASVEDALGARSIADLCREAAERGIERADVPPTMYQI